MQFSSLVRLCIIVLLFVLLLRFFPALWGGLLLLSLMFLLIFCYKWFSSSQKTTDKDQLSLAIKEKIAECQERANNFREEASKIKQQHQELAQQMNKAEITDLVAQQKAQNLLEQFDNEMSLRLTKATFFETSLVQLNKMLENRKLQQQLEKSEKELQEWKYKDFDSIAEVASMQKRIELDKAQLKIISSLAQRAVISPNLEQTSLLKQQLDELLAS